MSSPSHVADTPITDRSQLVEVIASGEKPRAQWRIGTEHEKFGFRLDDLRPPTFEGERGIEALLNGLVRFGWEPVQENGSTIALLRDGASVTLEPAGQLELSGAALETIHQTCVETGTHLNEVAQVAGELHAVEDALQGCAPDVRAVAGAIVSIDRSGEAVIHRGLLREAEAKALRTLHRLRQGFAEGGARTKARAMTPTTRPGPRACPTGWRSG